jgi:hypothetical protein
MDISARKAAKASCPKLFSLEIMGWRLGLIFAKRECDVLYLE